ncbi:MAG: metal ABC transporter permease [Thermoanaerobaculia bacterium]
MDLLSFLIVPFVAGLILTGIHAYLGVHVVERGVIFVDLSLAQIAALGTTMAYLAGHDMHDPVTYFWSLAFTIAGAATFAFTRVHRDTRIPQEAIIGIVYAVSAAAAILAMSKAPEGTEHLKDMLVGNILTVSWGTVMKTALLYAAVGGFHYVFRKKFLAISVGAHSGEAESIPHLKWWDFLFYTSFGFVVTSSVAIAGVLLVFSYLIVHSVGAMLFARSIGRRLAIGWTMGSVVSAVGIVASFHFDLPTGATIVCTFGLALVLMALVWAATRRLRGAAPAAG